MRRYAIRLIAKVLRPQFPSVKIIPLDHLLPIPSEASRQANRSSHIIASRAKNDDERDRHHEPFPISGSRVVLAAPHTFWPCLILLCFRQWLGRPLDQ
jgi:hypothetical protein